MSRSRKRRTLADALKDQDFEAVQLWVDCINQLNTEPGNEADIAKLISQAFPYMFPKLTEADLRVDADVVGAVAAVSPQDLREYAQFLATQREISDDEAAALDTSGSAG